MQCLGREEPCPVGYYYESVGPKVTGALKALAGKSICKKCHSKLVSIFMNLTFYAR